MYNFQSDLVSTSLVICDNLLQYFNEFLLQVASQQFSTGIGLGMGVVGLWGWWGLLGVVGVVGVTGGSGCY